MFLLQSQLHGCSHSGFLIVVGQQQKRSRFYGQRAPSGNTTPCTKPSSLSLSPWYFFPSAQLIGVISDELYMLPSKPLVFGLDAILVMQPLHTGKNPQCASARPQ
jgi:hypothetical protein